MSRLWRRVTGIRERTADVVMVVVLLALSLLPYVINLPPEFADRRPKPPPFPIEPQWTVVFSWLGCLGLLARRRWPIPTLAWTGAMAAATTAVIGETGLAAFPVMVALYVVAMRNDRRTWLIASALTAVAIVTATVATRPDSWQHGIGTLIWIALPPAIAEATRNRRAYLAAIEERARRAEETKEAEARRRVAQERIRIARELHDVLAHSVAVINIQSGVAAHVIEQNPQQAKKALLHINDASDAALAELRATVDLLRQEDEQAAPTAPLPDLGQIDDLLTTARTAGLDVRAHITGDTGRVPPETGLVAYRILQEALTNVLKHARARTVDVVLDVSNGVATLDVRDDGVGTTDPPPANGYGRIGMRERVHAVGGTLDDGPTGNGYQVSIELPLPEGGRNSP